MKEGKKTRHPGVYALGGEKWRIQGTAVVDGRRMKRAQVVEGSLEDAVKARAELVAGLKASGPSPRRRSRITIAECALRWLEEKAGTVRARTANHYRNVLVRHVLPFLGKVPVGEISREHVSQWVQWAEGRESHLGRAYSRDTLSGHWRVLVNFLRDMAADHGFDDPSVRVKPPRSQVRNVREHETLAPGDLRRVLEAVKRNYSDWYVEACVTAFTGMRAGELYALRWSDLKDDHMLVQRSVTYSRGQWYENPTKTGDSRVVPLTGQLSELLRQHRIKDGAIPAAHRLVFPASNGGFRHYTRLSEVLALAAQEAGVPVKVGPQVLRRTYNTLGRTVMNTETLQDLMGHTTDEMTQRYHRAPLLLKAQAMGRFEELILEGGNTTR